MSFRIWPDAPDSAHQVKSFFQLANSQIAKEVEKICGWTGGVFKEKPVITEIVGEEAQVQRFRYLMSQGVKEGLCPTPESWPGLQSAKAWLSGSMAIVGTWVHRTRLYELGLVNRKASACPDLPSGSAAPATTTSSQGTTPAALARNPHS